MVTLVFFLEELSAQKLLEGLLPRFLPMERFSLRFIPFEGKQDLEKQLVRKMRSWRTPDTQFIVLRDQDAADCKDVKARLVALCSEAGHPNALVRVACRELESWYLGDLCAVEKALGVKGLRTHQNAVKFRDPDHLSNPSMELERLTRGTYQKVSGSRAIGPHLDFQERNRSRSFRVFISGMTSYLQQQSE
ncbi:MAG: DUF4276 family protein [Deltaproteobacteria bacterium]|nr:DUF4276 family protein [Deltaproteobacteria bacterium]